MVIDLGEVRDAPVVDRPRWAPRRRRTTAAVVAAIALLATVGAASPVRNGLVEAVIPATAGTSTAIDGDLLFLTTPDENVVNGGARTVEVYRLPSARLVWKFTLDVAGQVHGLTLVDGVLVGVVESIGLMETIVLRPDTGQVLWRRAGWWQPGGPGHLLIWNQFDGVEEQRIESVALDTGAVRWSVSATLADMLVTDSGRILRWAVSGQVTVYDAVTGAVRASALLAKLTHDHLGQLAAGLLLIPGWEGERPIATAYGLDRLDRRWQADIDMRNEYVAGDCGRGLCVGRQPGGMRLIDAATGRSMWTTVEWGYAMPVGDHLVAVSQTDPPRIAVLDPATGRTMGDFGQWQTAIPLSGERTLGVLPESVTTRAWIGLLDLGTQRTQTLGVATGAFACQAGATAVVCRLNGGSIGVWAPRRRL